MLLVACRRDECERVKRCGAHVLTLDQVEGLKVCGGFRVQGIGLQGSAPGVSCRPRNLLWVECWIRAEKRGAVLCAPNLQRHCRKSASSLQVKVVVHLANKALLLEFVAALLIMSCFSVPPCLLMVSFFSVLLHPS